MYIWSYLSVLFRVSLGKQIRIEKCSADKSQTLENQRLRPRFSFKSMSSEPDDQPDLQIASDQATVLIEYSLLLTRCISAQCYDYEI